jgi:uncharacterized protein (TIGR02453 family)
LKPKKTSDSTVSSFNGFDEGIFKFLKDLEKHNSVDWFHKNRERYDKFLVEPAKAFIKDLAPFLNQVNPAIRTEPKFNETIMRLNKDMRFAKGDPYRAFLLIHFGRFKMDSEFFLFFEPDDYELGLFINNSKEENLYFKQNLVRYKKEIISVFNKFGLNEHFSMYELNNEAAPIIKKFHVEKHYGKLEETGLIILHLNKKPSLKKLYSTDIVPEMMKMITMLYPLYCFAISPQPLKELQRFEENF